MTRNRASGYSHPQLKLFDELVMAVKHHMSPMFPVYAQHILFDLLKPPFRFSDVQRLQPLAETLVEQRRFVWDRLWSREHDEPHHDDITSVAI